jgi:carbon storage regulator
MLVLSRKVDQKIHIGDDITIVVSQIKGNRVTIGIEAPGGVRILRGELQGVADQFDEPDAEQAPPAKRPPLFIAQDTNPSLGSVTNYFLPPNAR